MKIKRQKKDRKDKEVIEGLNEGKTVDAEAEKGKDHEKNKERSKVDVLDVKKIPSGKRRSKRRIHKEKDEKDKEKVKVMEKIKKGNSKK